MDYELEKIQKLLDAAEADVHSARILLRSALGQKELKQIDPVKKAKELGVVDEGKVVEGTYMGEYMHGADGKEYPVPANYASKSKLVEGDILKLTIAEDGSFIFKQIRPVERRKSLGTLVYGEGFLYVNCEGKAYKVLQASVTYYKGEPGDQVSIIIPKEHDSEWAAIDNIVKKGALTNATTAENPLSPQGPIAPVSPASPQTAVANESNQEAPNELEPNPAQNVAEKPLEQGSAPLPAEEVRSEETPAIVFPTQQEKAQPEDSAVKIETKSTPINNDDDEVKELEI